MKLLVAEDEPKTGTYLQQGLSEAGFTVDRVENGTDAAQHALHTTYDLLILDVMMPGLDGWQVLQKVRAAGNEVPVLFLTARDGVQDRVKGLELGADDYVIKPFSPKELEARIRAVLRRSDKVQLSSTNANPGIVQFNFLKIDFNRRQVYKSDERIRLTGMEFSLLELLIGKSGQAFSRAEILQEVWGYTPERHVDTRVVDVHISRLRAKLEIDPSNPDLILTARGTGYLFQRIVSPTNVI